MSLLLDHIAVCAPDLDAGRQFVRDRLGLELQPGGHHALFATHNLLARLGDVYLEVIAPDPESTPRRPRWFGLDHVTAPHLGNWILRCPDLDAALQNAPAGAGQPTDLHRGALRWRIAVPRDGSLPMGGAFPTLIEWAPGQHPLQALPDSGLRLSRLSIAHPQAAGIAAQLPGLRDRRITFDTAPRPGLSALIDTPQGLRAL